MGQCRLDVGVDVLVEFAQRTPLVHRPVRLLGVRQSEILVGFRLVVGHAEGIGDAEDRPCPAEQRLGAYGFDVAALDLAEVFQRLVGVADGVVGVAPYVLRVVVSGRVDRLPAVHLVLVGLVVEGLSVVRDVVAAPLHHEGRGGCRVGGGHELRRFLKVVHLGTVVRQTVQEIVAGGKTEEACPQKQNTYLFHFRFLLIVFVCIRFQAAASG